MLPGHNKNKSFTVHCTDGDCDWGWAGKLEWVTTCQEGRHWEEVPFSEKGRIAVLNYFGLNERNIVDLLPIEVLRLTSPCTLVAMRRVLESERNLPRKDIRCERSGGEHIPAEESRIEVAA